MMKNKTIGLLLLTFLISCTLCACGEKDEAPEDKSFTVSLQSTAGTGYYWDCELSEEGIVLAESEQKIGENPTPDSTIETDFHFTGRKRGTVTASFYCRQSWDDSVCYLYTCEMTVDRDRTVTGELSRQTVSVRPGEGLYKLKASDTSIALWTETEDGAYLFTALRDGLTTLTFTPLEDEEASERIFYLKVTEDGLISITEDNGLKDTETYTTLEHLEKKVGFSMKVPEEAEINEINSVGAIAYTSFTWNGIEFAYAGGELDLDAFRDENAEILSVAGHQVIVPADPGTTAVWEKDGEVYCISSEEKIPMEELISLLEEVLTAAPQG